MDFETIIVFAIVSFSVSLIGIYIGTKLSWREGRRSTESMLDKILSSRQAKQIGELLTQLNEFTHSKEGQELLTNLKNLTQDLRTVTKQLVGEGIIITPKGEKKPLITLPPKPTSEK